MTHRVSVYRRSDRYLFQAEVPHHTGYGTVPTDFVTTTPLSTSLATLGHFLIEALDTSASLPAPAAPSRRPPLLREAGARGVRDFFQGTKLCVVERTSAELVVTPMTATNATGSFSAGAPLCHPLPTSPEQYASHLLQAFGKCGPGPEPRAGAA